MQVTVVASLLVHTNQSKNEKEHRQVDISMRTMAGTRKMSRHKTYVYILHLMELESFATGSDSDDAFCLTRNCRPVGAPRCNG